MQYYTLKQVHEKGLLITKPSEQTIYKMVRDGRLGCADGGSEKRGQWLIGQYHIDQYNKNVENGSLPRPSPLVIKQPKKCNV
jgi:hypothetical protein